MQLYVYAKSKKTLNLEIANGSRVYGDEYSLNGSRTVALDEAPLGTVIKIYEKLVGGNPYAKSYGTIGRDKTGRVVVK